MARLAAAGFKRRVEQLRHRVRKDSVRVTLYSKPDCPLCAAAETAVSRAFSKQEVTVVNIMGNLELEDEYVFRIPVLTSGPEVLAEGIIDVASARHARRTAIAMSADRNRL